MMANNNDHSSSSSSGRRAVTLPAGEAILPPPGFSGEVAGTLLATAHRVRLDPLAAHGEDLCGLRVSLSRPAARNQEQGNAAGQEGQEAQGGQGGQGVQDALTPSGVSLFIGGMRCARWGREAAFSDDADLLPSFVQGGVVPMSRSFYQYTEVVVEYDADAVAAGAVWREDDDLEMDDRLIRPYLDCETGRVRQGIPLPAHRPPRQYRSSVLRGARVATPQIEATFVPASPRGEGSVSPRRREVVVAVVPSGSAVVPLLRYRDGMATWPCGGKN